MKPIYKSLALAATTLQVSVALQAQVNDGTATSQIDVPAEVLDSLRVELVVPNVSGARDLIKSGKCTVSDNVLNISLNADDWLKGGVYRLQVSATFGTQTMVIYALDVTVPRYDELAGETQEYEDTVTVVSTYGDGAGSQITVDPTPTEGSANPVSSGGVYSALEGKQPAGSYADGSIYQVGESGEEGSEVENVAKVNGHSVELSNTAVATGANAVAEGNSTSASGDSSHAEGRSTTASGECSHAEGEGTTARGSCSHAEGNGTTASGSCSHAEGDSTSASGYCSHAEGDSISASGYCSHAEGDHTSASGSCSHAEGASTSASGDYSHAEGEGATASGDFSHAEGRYTIASQEAQHVSGKYNIEDTDGDYAFIVGNGTADDARSNAFAIDWNGNLLLFNAGTPVVLKPAKLAQLIA